MLTPITREELTRYADWAYALALDLTRSGYPTYADGIKTREDFIRAAEEGMDGEREEVLLFRMDGEVCGWVQWSWQPEERYAQAYSFLTAAHAGKALEAFVAHASERCPGCALHMGFPADNADAVTWLRDHGFLLLEQSVHHTLFFSDYASREAPENVALMAGPEDETAFQALHTETDMFWTAQRILAHAADWRVYLYRKGGQALAALFVHAPAHGWAEVFGLCGDVTPETYRALMTACLNGCKADGYPHLTCFEEDERMLPILAELGFVAVSRYVCYQKTL